MAVVAKGGTLPDTGVTKNEVYALVDSATVSNIVNADVDASAAIVDTKLAKITTAGKISSSAITELEDGSVNPTNLLSNGDFECWSLGAASTPDGWTILDGSVAQGSSTPSPKSGTYYVEVTRAGSNAGIYNTDNATPPRGVGYWTGRTVTFGCWVYATVASRARLELYDGVSPTYSSYHTGGSTWEWLTVTKTFGTCTALACYCLVDTGNTTAAFDGAICVEGSSAFAFSPKPAEEGVWADYSATSTIVGWGSFTSKILFFKKIGKTVFVAFNISGVSNSATTTVSIPYTSTTTYANCSINTIQATDNTLAATQNWVGLADTTHLGFVANGTGVWTASGTKTVIGQYWYESA